MKEIPTQNKQAEFYDFWNMQYRSCGLEELDKYDAGIYKTALEVLRIVKSLSLNRAKILEIGCGTGWLTEKLCDFGKVVGIDLSPRAIDVAKQRNCNAEFIAADFLSYDQPLGNFDLVVCFDTIFYVSDQIRFVEKIVPLIKSGGFLILTTVNAFVYKRRSDIKPPVDGQIRNWLTRKELIELINKDFAIRLTRTVSPSGDIGLLRIVNSHKLNWLLSNVFPKEALNRAKEKIGLGDKRILVGQKR
jgi:2-polyprenyl-3-methyl-5-hydroxy-6-metoxy-1,4-benzoquinol methylase